jgi:hypothetical protein
MKPLRRRQGRSVCISERPENVGEQWGFEDWTMTHAADGMRVLNIHCELEFDGLRVTRDIVQSVHADYHPNDGYLRLMVNDRFAGSAWYRFRDDVCECEADTLKDGRISQRFPLNRRPMRGLGTHALQADGWNVAVLDYKKGPHREDFENNVMVSTHHLGATGPFIMATTSGLEYVGDESVEVPAGRFDCHHVRYVGMVTNNHPPYDLWVTRDGDFIFVKGRVEGYMAARFELVSLTDG